MTAPLLELRERLEALRAARSTLAARIAQLAGRGEPPAVVHAVDRVDLAIARARWSGLVGESGCGKSTLGRHRGGPDGADARASVHVPRRSDARAAARGQRSRCR